MILPTRSNIMTRSRSAAIWTRASCRRGVPTARLQSKIRHRSTYGSGVWKQQPAAFDKVRRGQSIDAHEVLRYKSALLATFFDRLDDTNQLTKTILYNLNPRDNELFATMIGNFQDGSVPGKMQYGSSWWFLDQIDGMTAQMRALSNMGLFFRFVGMVTDSRSFLSYSRHEYFRRLVCNFLVDDVRLGRLPDDREQLGRLAQDVSFFNARDYFGVELGVLGRHEARAA